MIASEIEKSLSSQVPEYVEAVKVMVLLIVKTKKYPELQQPAAHLGMLLETLLNLKNKELQKDIQIMFDLLSEKADAELASKKAD